MSELLDNTEVNVILNILENMEDEELAVVLLKEFNDKTTEYGLLVNNKDQNLDHAHWKTMCDDAKSEVEAIIKKIKSQ